MLKDLLPCSCRRATKPWQHDEQPSGSALDRDLLRGCFTATCRHSAAQGQKLANPLLQAQLQARYQALAAEAQQAALVQRFDAVISSVYQHPHVSLLTLAFAVQLQARYQALAAEAQRAALVQRFDAVTGHTGTQGPQSLNALLSHETLDPQVRVSHLCLCTQAAFIASGPRHGTRRAALDTRNGQKTHTCSAVQRADEPCDTGR